jgi:hypothetical protein
LSQIPIGTADTTGALQDTTKFNALKPNRIVRDMVTWLESPIGIASGAYNGIFERAKVAHRIQLNTGGEGRLCRPCGTNVYKVSNSGISSGPDTERIWCDSMVCMSGG